ncbi:ABC transporter ATP-binding protein [Dethiosulfatarculus sandiegensis]|nr:ABC transporter ATP-binding protein [Dethiosulfatarculus sandiegensis]
MPLIELKELKTYFRTDKGLARAVDGVNFSIKRERTLGVVGESGSGKSVTAMSIMGLIPNPPGSIEGGEILFRHKGQTIDLSKLPSNGSKMRSIRGNEIAMIFQEPMTSLNPVFTIGDQISEALILHEGLSKKDAKDEAIKMLEEVGIPLPAQRFDEYPHQLSGGMRQRAMIAMALSCNPALLIADEPTTALDVTIQAQVLELMNRLQEEHRTAIMFITHDLGVIANMADDVVVMYLGRIVESACVRDVFHNPRHPYTQGLMKSIPSLTASREDRLKPIKGVVPDLVNIPPGCGFEPRCPNAMPICREKRPVLREIAPGHQVSCWLELK